MSCTSNTLGTWPLGRNWLLWAALLLLGRLPLFASHSLSMAWYPSLDPDVISYKIYFGGASGDYTNSFDVGSATNVTVFGLTGGATYYFTATAVSSTGVESIFSNEASYAVPADTNAPTGTNSSPASQPPTLNAIANQTIYQNAGLQTVALTGISAGSTSGTPLTISAVSSDTTIIPTPTINYTSPNSTGTLTFTPVTGALGTATVTVTENNGGASNNLTSQTFTVTVVPMPVASLPPTLNAITNLTIFENSGQQTVALTGISPGSGGNSTVTISAVSSNTTVIPTPAVNYTSLSSTGTLTFTPAMNALGTAAVTVTVNNGGASNNLTSQTFTVTLVPMPVASQPPTLNTITNLTIYESSGRHTVALTGISPGSSGNSTVTVSAVSSNPSVIPTPTINYTNSSSTGTLTFAPATNALGTATVTVTVNNGGASNNLTSQAFTVTVVVPPGGNQPPTLNAITNVSMIQGTASLSIALTGISSGSPTEKQVLSVTATSSNPGLFPTPAIRYVNPASNAVLTLTPKTTSLGTALITVTVNDGGKSNNLVHQSFTVTVISNQPPTLASIANVTVAENATNQSVTLTGITPGPLSKNQFLTVTAVSSNARLLPTPLIKYSSPANAGVLTFRPAANLTGTVTVTVTVNNGGLNNNLVHQTFIVTVAKPGTNSVALSGVAPNAAATLTTVAHAAGQFTFQVTGIPASKYAVQVSSDMVHWTPVQTNTSPFTFQDNTVPSSGQRFYRALYLQ